MKPRIISSLSGNCFFDILIVCLFITIKFLLSGQSRNHVCIFVCCLRPCRYWVLSSLKVKSPTLSCKLSKMLDRYLWSHLLWWVDMAWWLKCLEVVSAEINSRSGYTKSFKMILVAINLGAHSLEVRARKQDWSVQYQWSVSRWSVMSDVFGMKLWYGRTFDGMDWTCHKETHYM